MQPDEPASPGDPQPAHDHPGEQEGASPGEEEGEKERFWTLPQQPVFEPNFKLCTSSLFFNLILNFAPAASFEPDFKPCTSSLFLTWILNLALAACFLTWF